MGDFQETCKTISLSKLFKFFQLTIYVHVGKPLKDLARKELKKNNKKTKQQQQQQQKQNVDDGFLSDH